VGGKTFSKTVTTLSNQTDLRSWENLPTLVGIEILSPLFLNQGELAQMESMKAVINFGDAEKFENSNCQH